MRIDEQTIRKWEALNMINVSETVDNIVVTAGERLDGKDKAKVDEVKRLILPFLPPIHKDYRLGNDFILYSAKWMPGEEYDESGAIIKTVRFDRRFLVRRGQSIWVTVDSLVDSAVEARIASVVVLSGSTSWYEVPRDTCSQVKVEKIIPIEQLCLYFKAKKLANFQVDLYGTNDVLLSDVGFSKKNTVFSAYFIHQNGSEHEERWYKQVDGTWYGKFSIRRAHAGGWYWICLEVLRQNQVERIR